MFCVAVEKGMVDWESRAQTGGHSWKQVSRWTRGSQKLTDIVLLSCFSKKSFFYQLSLLFMASCFCSILRPHWVHINFLILLCFLCQFYFSGKHLWFFNLESDFPVWDNGFHHVPRRFSLFAHLYQHNSYLCVLSAMIIYLPVDLSLTLGH